MPLNRAATVADQGHYFTANNLVTGVATAAAPTSISLTAPLFTIQNTVALGSPGPSIYLDWIRGYITATGAGGLSLALQLELDKVVPTGGTLLVPSSPNSNDGTPSVAAIRLLPTGIAATAAIRYVVGTQLVISTQTALMGVYTEFGLKFGGVDGYASTQAGTEAAGIGRHQSAMPPIVIAPGWALQVPFIIASQSAASSWSIEFGYVEF